MPTRYILAVSVSDQAMRLFARVPGAGTATAIRSDRPTSPGYVLLHHYRISTSRFGIGQTNGSYGTPVGLHRIARKIGHGQPMGTVFRGRRPIGLVWAGAPDTRIAHRILWLEGLEPGGNRGGEIDSFDRYIYLHGTGDETGLGRPASRGCVHLAAHDLIPLFDRVPTGTLVWISER